MRYYWLVVGDVVITINFPQAEIEKQASKDAEFIKGAPVTPDTDEDGMERFEEGGVDIGKTNKEITAVKKRMKERYDKFLLKYFDAGNIGEQIDGYVGTRNTDGLDLKGKSAMKKLVKAENEDRTSLYTLVAKINKVPKEVDKVAKIYAIEWRKNSKDKHYVQDDKGNWMTKKAYDESLKKKK